MTVDIFSEDEMKRLGRSIGASLKGGEVFELIGDIGAGKTTFTKGLAAGLAVDDDVQSPSFTISRTYQARDGIQLVHYDFYRLDDPGIMANEIAELVQDPTSVTVIEWADVVGGILPKEHIRVHITAPSETARQVELIGASEEVLYDFAS